MGDVKRLVEVLDVILRLKLLKVDEVRPMRMDEGIETESIAPGGAEVGDMNSRVTTSLPLAPQQESFLGRFLLGIFFVFFILRSEQPIRIIQ